MSTMNKPTLKLPVQHSDVQNDPYSTATINPGRRTDIPPTPFHRLPGDKVPLQSPPDACNRLHRRPSLNVAKHPPHSVNFAHNDFDTMALSYGGSPPPLPDARPPSVGAPQHYAGNPPPLPSNMPSAHYSPGHPGTSHQPQLRPLRSGYQGVPPPLPSSTPFSSAPSYRPYAGAPPGSDAMSPSQGFIGAGVPAYSGNPPLLPPSSSQPFPGAQQFPPNFPPQFGYGTAPHSAPMRIPGGYPGIPPPLPSPVDFNAPSQLSGYPPRPPAGGSGFLPGSEPGFSFDSPMHGYGSQAPPPGYAPGPIGYTGLAPPLPTGPSGFSENPYDSQPHQMQMQPQLQPQGSGSFGYGGRPPPPVGGGAAPFGYGGTPPSLPQGYAHPHGYAGGPPYDGGYLRRPGYKGRPPALPDGSSADLDNDQGSVAASAGGLSGLKQKFMQKVGDPNVLGGVGKLFGR